MKRWLCFLCLCVAISSFHLPARACSCGGEIWNGPEWWLENSDYVAKGEVLDLIEGLHPWGIHVVVRIHAVWKGEVDPVAVWITDRSSCGVFFEVGETYLVYLDEMTDGDLHAHACRRIQQGEWIDNDVEEIGPPLVVPAGQISFGMIKVGFESR